MSEEQEIQDELDRLYKRKQEILDKNRDDNKDFLLTLEWAKGTNVMYTVNHFAPYGFTEYILRFMEGPGFLKGIGLSNFQLMGDSLDYQQNLILDKDEYGYVIKTCNADLFLQFIDRCKPVVRKLDSWFTREAMVMAAVASCVKK